MIFPANENDFLGQDNLLYKFYSGITGKIKSNHIFSIEKTSKRFNERFMKRIKKRYLEGSTVIEHRENACEEVKT